MANGVITGPPAVDFYSKLSGLGDILQKNREKSEAAQLLSTLYGPQGGPSPAATPTPPAGQQSFLGAVLPGYAAKARVAESGGDNVAANPNSSALGPDQFIKSTWLENFDKTFPAQSSLPQETKLALRTDPKVSSDVMQTFTKTNEQGLAAAGVPINDVSRYAAHFFGLGDAPKVMTAPAGTPIENLVSPASIEANPFLKGKTVDQVRGWLQTKMGGASGVLPRLRRHLPAQLMV